MEELSQRLFDNLHLSLFLENVFLRLVESMETREVHISEDAEALFRCLADNKGTSCGTDEQTAINELTAGLNFQKCILVPKVELHDNRWVLLADEMEVLQTFKDSNVYDKNEYQNFAPLNSLRGWEPDRKSVV